MRAARLPALVLAVLIACGSSQPSPRVEAYTAALLACPATAKTEAESAACRAKVRCAFRASEFPAECASLSDAGASFDAAKQEAGGAP